jgi:hypothetical protein
MPLIKGKSKEAFDHNLKAEVDAGKPMKQSLAIAYAMKRKASKYADGGEVRRMRLKEMLFPEQGEEMTEPMDVDADDFLSPEEPEKTAPQSRKERLKAILSSKMGGIDKK